MSILRPGMPADFAGCINVLESLPESFNRAGIEACGRDLPETHVVVAGTAVEGFVAWRSLDGGRAEMAWLAVRPASQRRGLGTALVREAERQAAAAGASEMEVKTLAEGPVSPEYELTRRFYLVLGYGLAEVIDPYPGWEPGNPCAIFRRRLEPARPPGQ